MRPSGWWFDALLVAGFVLVTAALAARTPILHLDLAVRDWCDAHRPAIGYGLARGLNYLGQGGLVLTPAALLVGAWLGWRRRSFRPLLPVVGAFVLTFATVGPLKLWTDRLAASSPAPHAEWLFHQTNGVSYPSGHVVNAIVWYGVLSLLLTPVLRPLPRAVMRFGAPVIVLCTTTYLSFHWLTDGVAAVLLGVLLDRLLYRVPWDERQ